jgi:multidrug efflux pump subunit AcrB
VHNGFQVQTNAVSVNGLPGAILLVQKTGGVSTLEVIDGVLEQLHDIRALLPKGVEIKPMFDQSFFVKAAIHSVLLGGAIAAGLTGVMILLFLGNWRLTVIIVASIPLSVLTAITIMYAMGESLNTMTLGGFALAVGILVDNATVVIENIERNLGLGKELEAGIVDGAKEVGVPTLVSTLAICIVFVPIFLLEGVAKYLFSPLAVSVIVALLASLAISFTLVPVLFRLLIGPYLRKHGHRTGTHEVMNRLNVFMWAHWAFEAMYNVFRNSYRQYLSWAVHSPWLTAAFFVLLIASAALVYPDLGMDFFPSVDAGQMRLHVRTPPGTRIEQTKAYFADVERAIREITGEDLDVILDNIGLSYSGANIAMSDSATVGPMDGDILIALKAEHKVPTAEYMAQIREELPKKFPQLTMFFQASDIVNQVLNFGLPAPIDVRVGGPDDEKNYAAAQKILRAMRGIPGVVDAHIYQVPDAPAIRINVDRTLARTRGLTQSDIARSVLVSLSSSAAVSPTFWINPANGVSYPLVVQTPQYKIDNVPQLQLMPVTGSDASMGDQVLLGVASLERRREPQVRSATNLLPIYDIHANVQGRDLQAVAADLDEVVKANRPEDPKIKVFVSGQITTMRTSFIGLTAGMAAAVILVYLLMVMNFQSWLDPLIVLMAVPCALAGVVWMLYGTGTHVSVPALMGALMCIGLTTANSILVVAFARQQLALGETPLVAAVAAGYTRLRPVIMTAGAMILGMVPMALGIGEGGEQNAPLGRAVIGGLIFATIATLLFVPAMFRLMHSKKTAVNTDDAPARIAHA